jgi:hypothetical protein
MDRKPMLFSSGSPVGNRRGIIAEIPMIIKAIEMIEATWPRFGTLNS